MPDQIKVVVTIDISEKLLNRLRQLSPRLLVKQRICHSEEGAARALDPDTEILYTRYFPNYLEDGSKLKWIQYQAAGMEPYLESPIFQSDLTITNTSGAHAGPAAEFVVGMMVALARGFSQLLRDQVNRVWDPSHGPENELRGKIIGIVGYGSIGRQIARLADAMGMRILAVKRHPAQRRHQGFSWPALGDPEGLLPERFFAPSDLRKMLGEVDVLVITTPLIPETKNLIDEPELEKLKPTSYLINVARGGLVNMSALAKALREHWVAGAAVDVFEPEPLSPESDLWEVPNLFITPHVLAGRDNVLYDQRCNEIFAENLRRYLAREPLLNLVRRDLGY